MTTLLVIDMQRDFMPGGALPTKEGDHIIPIINDLMEMFPRVIATKDWHPKGHVSFDQWGEHCVQDTPGAEFAFGLNEAKIDEVWLKGKENDGNQLSAFGVGEVEGDAVAIVGVATEVCVLITALDAVDRALSVEVFTDAVRPIDPEKEKRAFEEMEKSGVKLIRVREVFA